MGVRLLRPLVLTMILGLLLLSCAKKEEVSRVEKLGAPDVVFSVVISEEKGYDPSTLEVRRGQVVEITVTSESNGLGAGVGFTIEGHEGKVNLNGIMKGQSRTVRFRADEAGTFAIYTNTQSGPKLDAALGKFIVRG